MQFVEPGEVLGRAWFSSRKSPSDVRKDFRDAYRRHGEVSVDRMLPSADLIYLRALHDQEAVDRAGVERFYGWKCFTFEEEEWEEEAQDASWEVRATPKEPINPWHADVVPFDGGDSLTELCTLVSRAEWLDRTEIPHGPPGYPPI